MAIIGDDTNYMNGLLVGGNTKMCVFGADFNVPAGKVYRIYSMKIKIQKFGAHQYRMGIYKRVDGYHLSELLAWTEEGNPPVVAAIQELDIVFPVIGFVDLPEGEYLFSALFEGGHTVYGDVRVGYDAYHSCTDVYGDGFSDPYNSIASCNHNTDYSRCIFADFDDLVGCDLCLCNACEDESEWTAGTDVTISVDDVNFQEGAGSIEIATAVAGARDLAVLPITYHCDSYWGFWLRAELNDGAWAIVGFRDGGGRYHRVRIYRAGPNSWVREEYNDGVVSGTTPYPPLNNLQWYWMEFHHEAGVRWDARRSDYEFGGCNPALVDCEDTVGFTLTEFSVSLISGDNGLGTIWIDFIRQCDNWEYPPIGECLASVLDSSRLPFMRTCSDIEIDFAHVLEWEESRFRTVLKKRVIGKCPPTVEGQHFITTPRRIDITCRVNRAEKEELWDAYHECCWMPLYDRGENFVDWVWMETPSFRWDSAVGCSEGSRPFIANLGFVCRNT